MSEPAEERKRSADSSAAPAIRRCPIHGIAYDVDREVCPECAKLQPAPSEDVPEDKPGG